MRRLGLVAVMVAPACGASARDLTVVAGGGRLQEQMRRTLFLPFSEAQGVPVADTSYDYNVGPMRAMVRAGNVVWDVVLVEAPDLVQGCDDGVFERIDWSMVHRGKFLPGGTSELACCRFGGHRDKVFQPYRRFSCSAGYSAVSSSLRR